MIPKKIFFTKGVGKHKFELQSFELALRSAGIAKCNIVNVSSIIPPKCKIIPKEKGVNELSTGQITYCVISRNSTNESNRPVGAAIGVAIPKKQDSYGYISEYHSYDEANKEIGDHAKDLAASMLATTLGLEFDSDKAWDERKQAYEMSGRIIRSQSIVQTALGDQKGLWTTVVAAAVFLGE
jgi:arginine decarboxylase